MRAWFRTLSVLLLAATLLPCSPVAAQGAADPPPNDDPIVVTGTRNQKEAIKNYVDDVTTATSDKPLSRYMPDEYCPVVLGLGEQRTTEIAKRMRTVAAAAGVKPAGEGCAPSALVIFVENKEEFLRGFRTQHPTYFIDLQGGSLDIPDVKGPAVAWHLVQLIDPQGMPMKSGVGGGYNVVESPAGGSLLFSMVRPVVAMSVLVVERSALIGLTGTQIADYALMRTLTDRTPDARDGTAERSIMGALEAPMGSAVSESLTQWDLAYLKARYSGHAARYGQSQATAIRDSMRRALARDRKK